MSLLENDLWEEQQEELRQELEDDSVENYSQRKQIRWWDWVILGAFVVIEVWWILGWYTIRGEAFK